MRIGGYLVMACLSAAVAAYIWGAEGYPKRSKYVEQTEKGDDKDKDKDKDKKEQSEKGSKEQSDKARKEQSDKAGKEQNDKIKEVRRPETATLHVKVTFESRPVEGARVAASSGQNPERIQFTNASGAATIQGVVRGTVLVQVTAPGYRTFGNNYPVDRAELDIPVTLVKN